MKNLRILVPSHEQYLRAQILLLVTSKQSETFWLPGETQLRMLPKIAHKRVILTLIPIASYLLATVPTDI